MIEEFEEFKSEHIRYDGFIINSVKKNRFDQKGQGYIRRIFSPNELIKIKCFPQIQ